jgi:uncharacterized protein YjaZ
MLVSILGMNLLSFGQTSFPLNPDSALFVTSDIDNFWMAYDIYKKDTTNNPFGTYYIDKGSAGVKGFLPNRIENKENLYKTVKKRSKDYEAVRQNTLSISEMEKQCRSSFYALKYWLPEALFPPVYFIIGAYNSGGTFNEDGLFIGAEKQNDTRNIPYIVAHELIHFQQKNWTDNPSLLQQSIIEGTADFIGELISGKNTNSTAMDYGNRNEDLLCKEFVSRMDGRNYNDWLYQVSGKDKRPNDLGYWMGYKISAQYFRNSTDKHQAIKDMLDIKDFKKYLRESGYLNKYLQ